MKTFIIKNEDIERKWYLVDAEDQILGRMSSKIASILRGKHKPVFSPHQDVGDFVIVVNADKVTLTGNKEDQKQYFRHSGYIGSLKTTTLKKMREINPEYVVSRAIWKMLPKNSLGRKTFKKLKVYAGSEHPHEAQNPETLNLDTNKITK